MLRFVRLSLALGIICNLVTNAVAIGGSNVGNEVPSARAAGAGYVGIAGQNSDPTAAYSNPAALTKLKGTQTTVGFTYENLHGGYESDSGAKTHMKSQDVVAPNFSMSHSLMDGKMGLGFTVQTPFGLETHWAGDSPMRYVATDSRLATVYVSPVIAYQVHPMVSVGAGPDLIRVTNAQLDRHINMDAINATQSIFTTGTADGISSVRGMGTTWGYHAGLMIEPNEEHALGITYHSKARIRVNGNLQLSNLSGVAASVFGGDSYSTSAYTDLVLPANLQLGYAYKPNTKWIIETDASWLHWSESRDLNVRFAESNATRLSVLNTGNPSNFNLRDAWSFAFGVNYKVTDRFQVRSGAWYEPWAMPEQNFNPAFLDLSRYGLSSGFGVNLTDTVGLDFAYTAVFMHNRSVHNSVGATSAGYSSATAQALGIASPDISGTYKDFANLVSVNLSYRFGAK